MCVWRTCAWSLFGRALRLGTGHSVPSRNVPEMTPWDDPHSREAWVGVMTGKPGRMDRKTCGQVVHGQAKVGVEAPRGSRLCL